MSETVENLDDRTFDIRTSAGVVLVDFWAPWCGPCRMQGPIVEQVAAKVAGRARVAKVNVDEAPEIAERFGIRAIPTLAVFRDGKLLGSMQGMQSAATLLSAVDRAATPQG